MHLRGALLLYAFALGCGRSEAPPQTSTTQPPPPADVRPASSPGDTEAIIRQGDTTITIVRGPDIPYSTDSSIVRSLPDSSFLMRHLNRQSTLLSGDTIHFYSAEGRAGWRYEGSPLDTSTWNAFEFAYPELHITSREFPVLYAAGRVALSPSIIGYVLRAPGMYSSSELDLWPYDTRAQRFGLPMRIAEHWGDEGYVFNEESWLVRVRSDEPYRLFYRRWHTNADMETDSIILAIDSIYSSEWDREAFGVLRVVHDNNLRRVFVAARRGAPR